MSRKVSNALSVTLRRDSMFKTHLELKFLDADGYKKAVHTVERTNGKYTVYSILYDPEADRLHNAMKVSKPTPMKQHPLSCESTPLENIEDVKDFLYKKYYEALNSSEEDDSIEITVQDGEIEPIVERTYQFGDLTQRTPCDLRKWCNILAALFLP